ncbi:hypothetical protein ACFUJR_25980 [Streptomyces sp. NPDC057271]
MTRPTERHVPHSEEVAARMIEPLARLGACRSGYACRVRTRRRRG